MFICGFVCMYVQMSVSDPLELEIQTAVSCHMCWDPGPLEGQLVLLTATEPPLQPLTPGI